MYNQCKKSTAFQVFGISSGEPTRKEQVEKKAVTLSSPDLFFGAFSFLFHSPQELMGLRLQEKMLKNLRVRSVHVISKVKVILYESISAKLNRISWRIALGTGAKISPCELASSRRSVNKLVRAQRRKQRAEK